MSGVSFAICSGFLWCTDMTREEQETIIRFDATPDKAVVYTCDPVWMRKMEKLERDGHATIKKDFGDGKEWWVDKSAIKVRPKRVMSEEQKEKIRNDPRMARVRFARGKTTEEK